MLSRIGILARKPLTNLTKIAKYHGGTPGENLPFSIENRYRLTAWFIVFFGSGLGAPFLILRHQLLKK